MVGLKIVQGVAALTQKIQRLHWGLAHSSWDWLMHRPGGRGGVGRESQLPTLVKACLPPQGT